MIIFWDKLVVRICVGQLEGKKHVELFLVHACCHRYNTALAARYSWAAEFRREFQPILRCILSIFILWYILFYYYYCTAVCRTDIHVVGEQSISPEMRCRVDALVPFATWCVARVSAACAACHAWGACKVVFVGSPRSVLCRAGLLHRECHSKDMD